jgi:signal transduction histidine kinase
MNTSLFALGGFIIVAVLLLVTIWYREKREKKRIQALTDYLEQINTGGASILTALGEDKFSKLEDEIYKTVTHLLQTKEAAVKAKRNFARNLENIAHQLKTPITALSLTFQTVKNASDTNQNCLTEQFHHKEEQGSRSDQHNLSKDQQDSEQVRYAQSKQQDYNKGQYPQSEQHNLIQGQYPQSEQHNLIQGQYPQSEQYNLIQGQYPQSEQHFSHKYWSQMEHQLQRLIKLEDALLLISRLDAGTLELKPTVIDVYTVLVLAVDNLQELLKLSHTEIDIPELGEMAITADLDWTMEAVLNLMKNGMEHHPGGVVHCSYSQNLLYTEILIWDEGEGFAKEDIPHLFERFYRGRNASGSGLGIGLALSKEILERQNGTLRAWNRPEGGACFEIHLYSH